MVVFLQNVNCETVRDSEYFTNELSNALACHWQVHHSHVEVTAVVCGAVGNMVGNASSATQAAVTVQQAANETGADYLQPNGTFSDAFAGILADGNSPGTVIDVAVAPTPVPTPAPVAVAPTPVPTPAPTSNEGSGTNHGLIGGVIGGIVAAGFVVFAVHRRRTTALKGAAVAANSARARTDDLTVVNPTATFRPESGPLLI